jgi:2-polyprenyl-6-methoxyphenol hydroxylase-like FAD-dependent oxidoreductase
MAEVVIIGAGIAGLSAALLLGRQGQRVILCERDPAPVPETIEEMWSDWPRPGVPQARLGHSFTPLFHRLLRERAPDVLARLWAAGSLRWDVAAQRRLPADADLVGILCRRPVLEGLLRQVVAAEPTVELRTGCAVVGLLAEPSALAGVPRVVGVRTRDHSTIAAQSVILAGGRHVPVAAWLRAIGAVEPSESSEGSGQLWYCRYFR